MNTDRKTLIGLLTLAAGAFGFYKYKNMSADQKAALKDKLSATGSMIADSYNDVETQVSDKLTALKEALERETAKAAEISGKNNSRKGNLVQELQSK